MGEEGGGGWVRGGAGRGEWGGGQWDSPQPEPGIRDEHADTRWHPAETAASLCACVHVHLSYVCVRVCVHARPRGARAGLCGQQISFEWLIWTKVAQEAGQSCDLNR